MNQIHENLLEQAVEGSWLLPFLFFQLGVVTETRWDELLRVRQPNHVVEEAEKKEKEKHSNTHSPQTEDTIYAVKKCNIGNSLSHSVIS